MPSSRSSASPRVGGRLGEDVRIDGGFDDVTGFQTFTFEEVKAAVDATHALGKKIADSLLTGRRAHAMPFALAPIRSNTRQTWTIKRLRKW